MRSIIWQEVESVACFYQGLALWYYDYYRNHKPIYNMNYYILKPSHSLKQSHMPVLLAPFASSNIINGKQPGSQPVSSGPSWIENGTYCTGKFLLK